MNKSGLLPIEQTVQNCLETNFAEPEKLRFIVGVSGGIDSICLLYILKKLDTEVIAVHINYQKRGEESDKDAEFVADCCRNWNLEYQIKKVDPLKADSSNFQEWARDVRYKVFEEEVQKIDADGIAVAHHKDDQIETILQKLFRGSGLARWSAMEVWNGKLFRPFLQISRDEIVQYSEQQSIAFRLDKSNMESNYARNFLRNEWLSEIKRHFPGWRKNVLRIAEQADIFKSSLEYILQDISDDDGRINRNQLFAVPSSLQKSLILFYIRKVDTSISISANALEELNKLPHLQTGKKIQLADGIEMIRDRSHFEVVIERLQLPASLILHRKQVQAGPVFYEGFEIKLQSFQNLKYGAGLYLDAQKFSWPLQLRSWKRGDLFQPLGMRGHQSVADHLTNRKISATQKSKALILKTFEENVAAVIFPASEKREPCGTISEQFKCDESTGSCLTIHLLS